MKKHKVLILVVVIIALSIGAYLLKKHNDKKGNKDFDYSAIDTSTSTTTNNSSTSTSSGGSRATQINEAVGDIAKGYQIYKLEQKTGVSFNSSILTYLKGMTLTQLKDLNKMSIDELRRYASNIF